MTIIDTGVLGQATAAWRDAPQGHKSDAVQKWACIMGISYQTLYALLPTNRERKGERKIDGLEEAARAVAIVKNAPPEHRGVLSTEDALKIALINGKIDARFAAYPPGTFDRVIRELGLAPKRRRIEPFQAEYPNQMHHVDASSSDCLYIAKALPDGDFLLKLHRGVKGYKNKPIPVDGLRPWYYGMTDDYSGVHCCRMVAAKGEQARHNMEFLAWAWWQQPERCFWGIPASREEGKRGLIKGDHGPMMESPEAKDFFDRCGVDIDPSTPLNKEAHGKIERPWRTLWQKFELPFFAMSDWKKFEITLSELNTQLFAYSAAYNERRHRYERKYSRRQMWERITLSGGVVELPNDALETIAKSNIERTVGQDGVFWMDNVPYEVKGLHDAKVRVIVGVFDKSVVVQDLADGAKYEVEAFVPNKLGEFKGNKETGQQQVRKEAADLEGITTTLYSVQGREALKQIGETVDGRRETEHRKVTKFPTRVKEVRKLENPLNVDAYPNLRAALWDFQVQTGLTRPEDFDAETRKAVSALIEENGLSRRYVAGLAADVMTEQVAYGS
jgi:hypothetical protein